MGRSLAINNSFTLKFENTTNSRQRISLFELGKGGTGQVQRLTDATTSNHITGIPTLTPFVWNFLANQPFVPDNVVGTNINYYPTASNFKVQNNGNFEIVSDNDLGGAVFSTLVVPVTIGMTLTDVNNAINDEIKAIPPSDQTLFRNAQGEFMQMFITFDELYIKNFPLPLGVVGATPYVQSWGISIQYPPNDLNIGSTGNPIRVASVVSPSSANAFYGGVDTIVTQSKNMANGVIVDDSSTSVSYDEIQRSQTGSVMDVRSMEFSVGTSPNTNDVDAQMLQPFYFQKIDVNGNDLSYAKVQVKDPYQFQDTYASIDMGTESDKYMLDGNTRFSYNVEPLTSLFITFNYTRLTILSFGDRYGLKKTLKEQEELTKYDNANDYAREYTLTPKKTKTRQNRNNFVNFKGNNIVNNKNTKILAGMSALFLAYKLLK
jgi:hypothetical protein